MLGREPHAHKTNFSKSRRKKVERFKKNEDFCSSVCTGSHNFCVTKTAPQFGKPSRARCRTLVLLQSRTTSTARFNSNKEGGAYHPRMAHPCSSPLRHTSYSISAQRQLLLFCTPTDPGFHRSQRVDSLLPKETPPRSRPSVCSL